MGFGHDIGIDLGTATVLVYIKGKGIVLREPSVVAIDKNTNKLLAVGEEARRMLGRTPGNIVAIRPLRDGVISDYDITERMLKYFINKVFGNRIFKLFKPRIMVCVPSGVTEVERRAVIDAAMQAGARKTYLIEEPIAAAIGAGIDISKACGSMIVDVGGGTTVRGYLLFLNNKSNSPIQSPAILLRNIHCKEQSSDHQASHASKHPVQGHPEAC